MRASRANSTTSSAFASVAHLHLTLVAYLTELGTVLSWGADAERQPPFRRSHGCCRVPSRIKVERLNADTRAASALTTTRTPMWAAGEETNPKEPEP